VNTEASESLLQHQLPWPIIPCCRPTATSESSEEPDQMHTNQGNSGEVELEWLENPVSPVTEVQNHSKVIDMSIPSSPVTEALYQPEAPLKRNEPFAESSQD